VVRKARQEIGKASERKRKHPKRGSRLQTRRRMRRTRNRRKGTNTHNNQTHPEATGIQVVTEALQETTAKETITTKRNLLPSPPRRSKDINKITELFTRIIDSSLPSRYL